MNLRDAFLFIINGIKSGTHFDSHYIIQQLIENYSDEYLLFCSLYAHSHEATRTAHAQIGIEISKLCDGIYIRQIQEKSWSYNIHHNPSECTLYYKI